MSDDSGDSRHGDDLASQSMPQHERQDAPGRAAGSTAEIETSRATSTPSPDEHSQHRQHRHHGGDSAPSSTDKKHTSTPPVVSSTTTATTPPSSPRTRTTTMSSPDTATRPDHHDRVPSSPRASLHAAAAAATADANDETQYDCNDKDDDNKADAKPPGAPESSGAAPPEAAAAVAAAASASASAPASATATLDQSPTGVVQQYSSTDAGLTSPESVVSIKILVSNNVAGSIIGRSGQSISDLQVQSSSRIKLSQSGDYYPGTADRVCLIQGGQHQVKVASSMIMQRIQDLQRQAQQRGHSHIQKQQQHQQLSQFQHQPQQQDQWVDSSASSSPSEVPAGTTTSICDSAQGFIVRVLVPTPSCGMIIGRNGSNIKRMAETSGVTSIRLSPKEEDGPVFAAGGGGGGVLIPQQHQPIVGAGAIVAATGERIVTISGPSLSSTVSCVGLVIDGLATHPEIGRYSNMTTGYSRASSSISAAATATVNRGSSAPFYAPVGPYTTAAHGLARQTPMPPAAASMAGYTASSGLVLNPPSPLTHGQAQQPFLQQPQQQPPPALVMADSSSHGEMDSLGQSQHQQQTQTQQHQQIRYAPMPAPAKEPPSLYQSPHPQAPSAQPMYATSPATPIPNLHPSPYGAPLSPQHPDQPFYLQTQHQQRASMYSPVGGRSRSNLSRESSQDDIGGPFLPTNQLAAMQVGIGGAPSVAALGTPIDEGRFVPDVTQRQPQGSTLQMAIPDALIGAILGRGGQTLNELQVSTSTRIKISQRGVYVPGTTDRVVTITGPSGESVATAQYLVNQRLTRSKAARQQQQTQQQQQQQQQQRPPPSSQG